MMRLTFVLLAGAILVCLSRYIVPSWADLSEGGLVGYWRLDEAGGDRVLDASGRGHDGALVGPVARVPGRVGQALSFRGEKGCGAVIADAPDLNPTTALTLEAWVKPEPLVREQTYEIINKAGDRGPGYRLFVSWAALRFVSGRGFGQDYWDVTASLAEHPMRSGLWHHLAAVYDGQTYYLYLDGIEVTTSRNLYHEKATLPLDGSTHPITVSKTPLTIGSFQGGYAYPFLGAIDEVKIYNRAKTAEEVFQDAKER